VAVSNPGKGSERATDVSEARFAERLVTEAPWLSRRLQRIVPGHAADDVAHEALLRAWAARGTFDDSQPLRPWLLTIGRRLAIDELRRSPASGTHPLDIDIADVHWSTDPQAHLDRESVQKTLGELLDALPERHRRILAYRYEHGLSFADIADLEGSTTSALKPLVSRTRKLLRESYDSTLGRMAVVFAAAGTLRRAQNVRLADAAVAAGTLAGATALALVTFVPPPPAADPTPPRTAVVGESRPAAHGSATERGEPSLPEPPSTFTAPPASPRPAATPAPQAGPPRQPPVAGPHVDVERTPETFAVHHDESVRFGDLTVPGGQGHIMWECPDADDQRPHCLAIRALAHD